MSEGNGRQPVRKQPVRNEVEIMDTAGRSYREASRQQESTKAASRFDRRSFFKWGTGAAAAVAIGGPVLATPAAAANTWESVDLGVAMTTVNTRYATSGVLPDGTPAIFQVSQGTPSSFNVTNAIDGSSIDAFTIDIATSGSDIVISPDQQYVYFAVRGGGGHSFLYRYDVTARDMTLLATDPADQEMIRSLVVAPDGMVYGATFPDAKVFSYDPATEEVHDYGSMTDDGQYAWGFELVDDKLWVGTGIGQGRLFELDPATGEKSEMTLPEYAAGATNFMQIARRENLVIAAFTPSTGETNNVIYDLDTGQWGSPDTLAVMGLNAVMTPMTPDGVCYYQRYDGSAEIYSFDPATLTAEPTGWAQTPIGQDTTGWQNMGLVEIDDGDGPRTVITGMLLTGQHWLFDPQSGDYSEVDSDVEGAPIAVHTLDLGPDSNVYAGAHLSSGTMAMIDTRTDTVQELSGPSQADAVAGLGDHIVVGTYPGVGVYTGNMNEPWQWDENPSLLFSLDRFGDYEQDRPRIMIAAGDHIAMGTVPNYGLLGGALTLFGLDGEFTFHRDIVPDQSIVSLAYQDGLIIGGTSIDGGIDSTPAATDAEVFIWDTATEQVVFHDVPAPGARSIGALATGDDGMVWGLSDTGVLFEVDPVAGQIRRTVPDAPTTATTWGSSTYLDYRRLDGLFYGANGARMFTFNPDTEQIEVNMEYTVSRIAVTKPRGQVYFSSGTNVYRYLPPARSGR